MVRQRISGGLVPRILLVTEFQNADWIVLVGLEDLPRF